MGLGGKKDTSEFNFPLRLNDSHRNLKEVKKKKRKEEKKVREKKNSPRAVGVAGGTGEWTKKKIIMSP